MIYRAATEILVRYREINRQFSRIVVKLILKLFPSQLDDSCGEMKVLRRDKLGVKFTIPL